MCALKYIWIKKHEIYSNYIYIYIAALKQNTLNKIFGILYRRKTTETSVKNKIFYSINVIIYIYIYIYVCISEIILTRHTPTIYIGHRVLG